MSCIYTYEKQEYKIIPLNNDEIELEKYVIECDLLIGGVLVPGANAPKLISKNFVRSKHPNPNLNTFFINFVKNCEQP